MNPAIMLPGGTSIARQALRSLAVNLPLAGAVAAGFAAIHAIAGYVTPGARRSTFLRTLARDSTVTHTDLLAYLDSRDPIAKAKAELAGLEQDSALGTALRKALAEVI